MQRKFINNLIFVLFINLLVKPFWILGIDLSVQNRVGAEEYGFYASLFSFSILLNIILDFGITNYNNRNIAQHSHMLGRYFSGILNVKLTLGILYFVITLISGAILGYESREIWLLFILGINQFLASLVLYLRSNLSGLHLFKTDGLLSIMDRLIMIVVCGILLWGGIVEGDFKIEWFVYAQLAAYLFTTFLAFILVLQKAKFYRLRFDFKIFRIILKESYPFALLVLLMSFYYRLDSVMLERMLTDGKRVAGVYAQSYRLLDGFNMLAYLFAALLLPIFSKMLKEKLSVSKLVNTSFNLIFIPATAIATISWLYATEIMDLLYIAEVSESAQVYGVLMLSFVAIALTYIYGTLLTANGNLKQLNIISFSGLVINFSLNYLLIPTEGAYGAAIATLITQLFVVLAQIIASKKLLKMHSSFKFILKHIALLIIGIGVAKASQFYFDNFIVHSILIFVLFGIISILLRLVKKEEIFKLLKST